MEVFVLNCKYIKQNLKQDKFIFMTHLLSKDSFEVYLKQTTDLRTKESCVLPQVMAVMLSHL